MQKVLLTYLILSCFCLTINAQTRPILLPDNLHANEQIRCFCKPGVANKSRTKGVDLSYSYSHRGIYNDGEDFNLPYSTHRKLEHLTFKLKFPILNKDHLKIIGGFSSMREWYDFSVIGPDYSSIFKSLDETTLKTTAFGLTVIKPINEKLYTTLRLKGEFNGDYKSFFSLKSQYLFYNAVLACGFKRNENTEWGVGLVLTGNIFQAQQTVLPVFLWNKNFSDHFGIEMALPAFINLRYNNNSKRIFLIGAEYNSNNYVIDVDTNSLVNSYTFGHSSVRLVATIQQHLHSWVWMSIKGGYQVNFTNDFEVPDQEQLNFMADPTDGLFLKFSVFISPSDDFLNKR